MEATLFDSKIKINQIFQNINFDCDNVEKMRNQ